MKCIIGCIVEMWTFRFVKKKNQNYRYITYN